MALDYSERGIWSVDTHGMKPQGGGIGTAVSIYLTGQDNPDQPGPNIDIHFAFPASHELSLQELEREALAAASALLKRFAHETPESLLEAAQRTREKPQILGQG